MKQDLKKLARAITSRHELFVPLVVEQLDSREYIQTRYDPVIDDALDRTITGEIKRLIINIPPGYGKTLRAVWAYVSRGFALNPSSRFIHASYSDKLVQDNSLKIRDVINSEPYRQLFPYVNFKQDSNAKGLWNTSMGGAFLASPAGGTITGFRAGVVGSEMFAGALIIDDPLKPDDALSDTKREFINQRWDNTFKSRLADENVPVIVIMQRLHDEDFTAELLNNSDDDWHHLVLPVMIQDDYEYNGGGIYIDHGLEPGPLWDQKHSEKQAIALMREIQYSQEPDPAKGEVYEREWFKRWDELPSIKSWSIYCDTASKTKKYNDYSVFQIWAKSTANDGYLVDQWREKVQVPFLRDKFKAFYAKHKDKTPSINIEDKDSGVGLIQALRLDGFKVNSIQRKEGKYARSVKAAPHILHGHIYIMRGPVGDGVITEATKFKADDSHKHDDQIDPMADFINYELPPINQSTTFNPLDL